MLSDSNTRANDRHIRLKVKLTLSSSPPINVILRGEYKIDDRIVKKSVIIEAIQMYRISILTKKPKRPQSSIYFFFAFIQTR